MTLEQMTQANKELVSKIHDQSNHDKEMLAQYCIDFDDRLAELRSDTDFDIKAYMTAYVEFKRGVERFVGIEGVQQ